MRRAEGQGPTSGSVRDDGVVVGPAHRLGVEAERVQEFYKRHWLRPVVLSDDVFYRWQFLQAPEAGGRDHCCVAIDRHGELLGVMGAQPRPFELAGELRPGAELTTWVTAPEARGRGIGRAILADLQRSYDVLVGLGITEAAIPLYRLADFGFLRAIPRFLRVFDPEAVVRFGEVSRLGHRLIESRPPRRVDYSYERCDAGELAALLADAAPGRQGFVRDARHLEWRYLNHPVFDYEVGRLEVGASPTPEARAALVVLRVEDSVAGLRFVHVLDLIPLGTSSADPWPGEVFAALDALLLEHDASAADMFSTHSGLNGALQQAGWLPLLDESSVRFPHLFRPIEIREPASTSMVYWSGSSFARLADLGRVYLTKQDCDFDRPTVAGM